MGLDVANIDRNYKNTWRAIYEAIDEHYFGELKLFTIAFNNICKNHLNEPQNIPDDIKNNLKTKSMEANVYSQVMNISHKIMVQKKKPGGNLKKYLFKVQSTISKHWFDLDIEWVKEISVQ